MQNYEENRPVRPAWSWVILILFCAAIVGWGLLNYATIKDRPRAWDFGQLKDTPAESIVSTRRPPPPGAAAPPQITTLPAPSTAEGPASPESRPATAPVPPGERRPESGGTQ